MKYFSKLIFSITLFLCVQFSYARTLNVASLNLQWFGLGGEISGLSTDEYRVNWIKEFLKSHYKDGDVISFQEVIDMRLLNDLMQSFQHKCISYKSNFKNHQKVAICYNDKKYTVKPHKQFPKHIIKEIAYAGSKRGGLRPAVLLQLIDKKSKKNIATIVAVHLKASSNKKSVRTRIEQVEILAQSLEQISGHKIILGDFNSHKKTETHFDKDDLDFYQEILSEYGLKKVNDFNKVTYRVKGKSLHLDHIFVSKNINSSPIKVNDACKYYGNKLKRFSNFVFYNRFISDHCLIQSQLTL